MTRDPLPEARPSPAAPGAQWRAPPAAEDLPRRSDRAARVHTTVDRTLHTLALSTLPEPETPALLPDLRAVGAGLRLVLALWLPTLVPLRDLAEPLVGISVMAYATWALLRLRSEARATGAPRKEDPWIDLAWVALLLHAAPELGPGTAALLMLPAVGATVLLGWAMGAAVAGAGAMLVAAPALWAAVGAAAWPVREPLGAGLLLLSVPLVAWVTLPLRLERRRQLALAHIAAEVDPRRGLESLAMAVAGRVRVEAAVPVVAWLNAAGKPGVAVVSSAAEGDFAIGGSTQERIAAVLQRLPQQALSYRAHSPWRRGAQARTLGGKRADTAAREALAELAQLFEVETMATVPLRARGLERGWILIGHDRSARLHRSLPTLQQLAPELVLLAEQAALVDELQDETAAHERARIGRDLHDSAIQPYLGLKFAAEALATRCPRDNPMHADLQALASLVNGELAQLRETISSLRSGGTAGDNALIPALRRQLGRFSVLFGIRVELEAPERLPTSRALAAALFHMVNEALNNIRKHTSARHAWVRLSVEETGLRLAVRDDAGSARGQPSPDFVPASLQERVGELGGTLALTRVNRVDTEIVITIPLAAARRPGR
jgi:signal transduction histidine kinase